MQIEHKISEDHGLFIINQSSRKGNLIVCGIIRPIMYVRAASEETFFGRRLGSICSMYSDQG